MVRSSTAALALALSVSVGAIAEEVWDGPPLSADPQDVIAVLKDIPRPEGADVQMLLDEMHYTIDVQRRVHYTSRRVYRCLTRAGARDRAFASADWYQWYEERPQLEARVITAAGKAFPLDPKSIGEVTGQEKEELVLGDRKELRAPLPAVGPGCVVEIVVRGRQTKPFFDAGQMQSTFFFTAVPAKLQRLVVDAPQDAPLRFAVRGLDIKPQVKKEGGRVSYTYERRDVSPSTLEFYLPTDRTVLPYIAFATGKSWEEVGAGYHKVVEQAVDVEHVRPLVEAAVADAKDRDEKVQKILQQLQRLVRYTAVTFGEAAIVPRTPQQILARRYGDCKDQAVLLVSMLRAAGIDAHAALLRSGFSEDVPQELTGLNVFNHVIVYVPGERPLWIDPTARFRPAGELPLGDQGRWALIADGNSKRLVKTPRSRSTDNRQLFVREYRLRQWEPSTLIQSSQETGDFAAQMRAYNAELNEEQALEVWRRFGQQLFLGAKLNKLERSDPLDATAPAKVKVQYESNALAQIDRGGAIVRLSPKVIFENLPQLLFVPEQTPRANPVQLPNPHVKTLRYHLVPPPGFVPVNLPDGSRDEVGPLALTVDVQRREDNSVVVEVQLDTGDGLFSVDDVAALRKLLADRRVTAADVLAWRIDVQFESTARRLLEVGKTKAALAEYRRWIDAQPNEHTHRLRYAAALLHAGFGAAAREQAQLAVEKLPDRAYAWTQLAQVLSHDLLGRQFQPGMDWRGAAAAYQKALKLDPDNVFARWNYAILLEHDEDGRRHAPGARPPEAIDQYERCLEVLPNQLQLVDGLLGVMLYREDFAALKKRCQTLPAGPGRNRALLAAIAAVDGVNAAEAEAARRYADENLRRIVLLGVGDLLSWSRQYEAGAEMIERQAAGHPREQALKDLAAKVKKTKRREEAKLADDDPRLPVRKLLADAALSWNWPRDLKNHFARGASEEDIDMALGDLAAQLQPSLAQLRAAGRTPQWSADWLLREVSLDAQDVSEGLWRVTAKGRGMQLDFLIAKDEGKLRILPRGRFYSHVGAAALASVDKDPARARSLLQMAFDDAHQGQLAYFDPYSGSPFGRLWKWGEHDDGEQVRAAAAALASIGAAPQGAIAHLLKRSGADGVPKWQQIQIDRALAEAYLRASQGAPLLKLSERMFDEGGKPQWHHYKAFALLLLGKSDQMKQHVEGLLKEKADDEALARAASRWLTSAGDYATARQLALRVKVDDDDDVFLKHLAWLALFSDDAPDDEAVKQAEQAVLAADFRRAETRRLLACVYAKAGRTDDARGQLLQAVDERPSRVIDEDDWLVLGQIAEQYEMPALAADCYAHIDKPTLPYAGTAWDLAQLRLAKIKAARQRE